MKKLILMTLAASFLAVGAVYAQARNGKTKKMTKTEMSKKGPSHVGVTHKTAKTIRKKNVVPMSYKAKGSMRSKKVLHKRITKRSASSRKMMKSSKMMKRHSPAKHMVSKKSMMKKTNKGTKK